MNRHALWIVVLLVAQACTRAAPSPKTAETRSGPPETRKAPVTDTYHGVSVVDDYRWLEDWKSPEVRNWSEAQNAYARAYLNSLAGVDRIRKRVTDLMSALPVTYDSLAWSGGRLFGLKMQPPKNQPMLVVMPSADEPGKERMILDPNQLDTQGTTAIDWFVASPDGKQVAVSLSKGGSEAGDLHVYETDTGREVEEVIPHVSGGTAGGDLAWASDGSGFFYTRYPRPGERPDADLDFFQQLWFHQLGTKVAADRYELGKDFDRIAEIEVDVEPLTGEVLAQVQVGDSGRFAFFGRDRHGQWSPIAGYDDGIVEAVLGPAGSLFLVSRKDAPKGRVLSLENMRTPLSQAREIIPQCRDNLVTEFYGAAAMLATASRLYLIYQLGGPSEIRVFDHHGTALPSPSTLPVSSVGINLVPLDGDDILFSNESYLDPDGWYRFAAQPGATLKTGLMPKYAVDFSDVEVVRELAVSKDGTRVPLNILRKKGTALDGKNPTILYGYGGYALSLTPRFSPIRRIWFDAGGVFAYANLRGGAEFGESWHMDGMLTKKQNVFDDFAACMELLIKAGYTNADRLAIEGGSNGGLLMGAMIAQHPDLTRTAVSFVGMYDMLRSELSPNGSFNIPEFGTVKDPEQFKALYAYSPYHGVKDGVPYPAVLFLTGANDPRVDPMHSRKMTARLQAATSSGLPILLRTSASTGHGIGSSLAEQIEENVDVFAFLMSRLGMTLPK